VARDAIGLRSLLPETSGHSVGDDKGEAETSNSFPVRMLCPLLNGWRVSHWAGGHAVTREKGCYEILSFSTRISATVVHTLPSLPNVRRSSIELPRVSIGVGLGGDITGDAERERTRWLDRDHLALPAVYCSRTGSVQGGGGSHQCGQVGEEANDSSR
jgi:hypothetical protein